MNQDDLKKQLADGSADFREVIVYIDEHYAFTPTAFVNGRIANAAGENNGSCKLFAMARLNRLTEGETLACFGHYYRRDVLGNPEGTDHQNIRNFMRFGWAGIRFQGEALKERQTA